MRLRRNRQPTGKLGTAVNTARTVAGVTSALASRRNMHQVHAFRAFAAGARVVADLIDNSAESFADNTVATLTDSTHAPRRLGLRLGLGLVTAALLVGAGAYLRENLELGAEGFRDTVASKLAPSD